MQIIQITIIAIVGVLFALTLKKSNPQLCMLLSIVVSVCIFSFILGRISILLEVIEKLKNLTKLSDGSMRVVLKMIGITYLSEFTVGFCEDAGFSNIGTQVELFSKVAILILALPAVEAFLNLIASVVV